MEEVQKMNTSEFIVRKHVFSISVMKTPLNKFVGYVNHSIEGESEGTDSPYQTESFDTEAEAISAARKKATEYVSQFEF